MHRDVKDIIGALMRVLDGEEIPEAELAELVFEAEGDLETALNDSYVKLGEFARALDARRADPELDLRMRGELHACLDTIVAICDAQEAPRKH